MFLRDQAYVHFISNYSPSSGRTQVTPSWTELYLDKLPSWKWSTSVSLIQRSTSYQRIPTCRALKKTQNIQVSLFCGLGLVGDSAGLIEVVSISSISKRNWRFRWRCRGSSAFENSKSTYDEWQNGLLVSLWATSSTQRLMTAVIELSYREAITPWLQLHLHHSPKSPFVLHKGGGVKWSWGGVGTRGTISFILCMAALSVLHQYESFKILNRAVQRPHSPH